MTRLSTSNTCGRTLLAEVDALKGKDYDGRIEKVYFDISRRFDVGYNLSHYT
jgi:hypothetical protein